MKPSPSPCPSFRLAVRGACLLALTALWATSGAAAPQTTPTPVAPTITSFSPVNKPGFGDPKNSYSWSMQWFNGNLYVGTNRQFPCVEDATLQFYYPTIPGLYNTNPLPGVTCPANPADLNLQAEIWCYTPATSTWTRVYQSPTQTNQTTGQVIARDIGYRDMVVYTEPSGQTALYVLGCTAREFTPWVLPARILRSYDGVNWQEVPDDGSLAATGINPVSFRASAVYNGQLYVTLAPNLTGDGVLLKVTLTAQGLLHYDQVAPTSLDVYELNVFNGYLYIGVADKTNGYAVWKMDSTGALTAVVTGGAGRGSTMASVVSMHVFQNKLYVGSAGWFPNPFPTCELIRIYPDDSFEVVVGNPRQTTAGLKYPISGLPDGFGNPFNAHVWRMEDRNGVLYAGTNDDSWGLMAYPLIAPYFQNQFGFDLFSSADGRSWTQITQNAFGHPYAFGCRTIVSTTAGLFIGSVDYAEGTIVFLGTDPVTKVNGNSHSKGNGNSQAFLSPVRDLTLVLLSALVIPDAPAPADPSGEPAAASDVGAPAGLSVERIDGTPVLSWQPSGRGVKYQVMRSEYRSDPSIVFSQSEGRIRANYRPTGVKVPLRERSGEGVPAFPGEFEPVATTRETFFKDVTAKPGRRYEYQVTVLGSGDAPPVRSNLAVYPPLSPVVTVDTVASQIHDLSRRRRIKAKDSAALLAGLRPVRETAQAGNWSAFRRALDEMRSAVAADEGKVLNAAEAEGLKGSLESLSRRAELARAGVITPASLLKSQRTK